MPIFVGALLLFMGNLLPRARSDWLFGIRTLAAAIAPAAYSYFIWKNENP